MLKLFLCIVLTMASNINCGDSSCTYCLGGYLYNSTSCLPLCPTGYTQNVSPNTCSSSSSQSIFSLDFYSFRQYSSNSIGNFQHPLGLEFQDSARGSPIPTKDRGFYFGSTSRLISTVNCILGPDLTLRFCLLVTADGIIFEATSSGISYFKVAAISGNVNAYWYLTSASSSYTQLFYLYTYTANWACSHFYSSQGSEQISLSMIGGSTTTIVGYEYRGQVSDMVMYFGGQKTGGAFTGFIDSIRIDNLVSTTYDLTTPIVTCKYNYYTNFVDFTCYFCTGCTRTWPWCTSALCSTCYSDSCLTCGAMDTKTALRAVIA